MARYYRVETARNQPVSTEITGYTIGILALLHSLNGDPRYLDRARAAAAFLRGARQSAGGSMPFETDPASLSYFFDNGIIARGLLALWRATADAQYLADARAIGDAMERDFVAPDGQFHPIVTLPAKTPLDRDPLRWSRSPGCYQLKSAMAWWDLAKATGNPRCRTLYDSVRRDALASAPTFLPGHPDSRKVVDRLHAFLYYLEGLLPAAGDPACAAAIGDGIQQTGRYLRDLAPQFERSDVYAQLLRVRLYAADLGAVRLDHDAAAWEAAQLAEFAATSDDARIDGGFFFGRSAGAWEPFVNPVSTAFAIQALALWNGDAQPRYHPVL